MSVHESTRNPDLPVSDGLSLNLGLFAEIGQHLRTLSGYAKREQERRDAAARRIPIDVPLSANGVFPASGYLSLDLGSCPQGCFWMVRRINVGGLTCIASAAGAAHVFVQGANPNPSLSLFGWVCQATQLPLPAYYGSHELVVQPGEHIWVVFVNGTANQTYAATAKVEQYDLALLGKMQTAE